MQAHIGLLEDSPKGREALLVGLDFLLNISFVPDDEVFKIALDYWNFFVPDVYSSAQTAPPVGAFAGFGSTPASQGAGRKQLYQAVLSRLRLLMISRMAKPEEVCSHVQTLPTQPSLHVLLSYTEDAIRLQGRGMIEHQGKGILTTSGMA